MAITQNTYTGNGSTTNYSFTFPYLEATDIKVSLNGTLTTAYTLANATTIQFNTAPGNGVAIRIYRATDDENLAATFYPGSAIRSADLNNNFTQTLYKTQETTNYSVQDVGNVSLVANYTFNGTVAGQTPTLPAQFATKAYVDTVAFAGIGNGDKGDITVNSATSWSIDTDAITTSKIANGAVTAAKLDTSYLATSAIGTTVQAYDANTAKTNVAQSYSAAQRGTHVTLTDGATITPDFAAGNHFTVTLGGNRTLANPTNLTAGQSGVIYIVQDGTGSRTLAYGSNWDFAGGTAPTLSTAANAVDVLAYAVRSNSSIAATLVKDVK